MRIQSTVPLKYMRIRNCEYQEHDLKQKLNIFSIVLFCIIPVNVVVNAEESDNTVSSQTKRQQ